MTLLVRILALSVLLTASSFVLAQVEEASPDMKSGQSAEMDTVMRDYYAQALSVVKSSDSIRKQITALRAVGKTLQISVQPSNKLPQPKGKMFGGFLHGQVVVLSYDLLQAYRKGRIHDVVYEDDILPDHVVFAIAHLAHHLSTTDTIEAARNSQSSDAYLIARLEDEASAWIVGWNATVEAAVKRNADKTLSSRQLSQLLMNFQYRYMLFRAMKLGTPPSVASDALVLLPSGVIETNKHNIDAIVQALRASRMGNIE